MKEADVHQAPILSMKNSDRIAESKQCGCYHCLETCSVEEIKEWTDGSETALCPNCGVDSLIPDQAEIELTKDNLQAMHQHWFEAPPDNMAKLSGSRRK